MFRIGLILASALLPLVSDIKMCPGSPRLNLRFLLYLAGVIARGVIAIGAFPFGLFSLGGIPLGVCCAVGGAAGSAGVAIGQVAVGGCAGGQLAMSSYRTWMAQGGCQTLDALTPHAKVRRVAVHQGDYCS